MCMWGRVKWNAVDEKHIYLEPLRICQLFSLRSSVTRKKNASLKLNHKGTNRLVSNETIELCRPANERVNKFE